MWKKPRAVRPEDFIYPDRCMLKWQGMLLSDHNERMRFDQIQEAAEKEERYHTEAELEDWDDLIMQSKKLNREITILVSRPNEPEFRVTGTVRSIRAGKLHIQTEGGECILFRHEVDGIS